MFAELSNNVGAEAEETEDNSKPSKPKAAAVVRLDDGQLSQLYSECIKLATANKINQKNTWDLNLIDHMDRVLDSNIDLTVHDDETVVSDELPSSQGEPGRMNFQKASCTLDAR